MSYDISFWKLTKPGAAAPHDTYRALCAGKTPRGLEKLPVVSILRELKRAFPELDPKAPWPTVQTPSGTIELSWSSRHFRFDFRGLHERSFQRIVSLMRKFGCPMYDSQLEKRYDAKNGMAVGRVAREKRVGPGYLWCGTGHFYLTARRD